MKLDAKTALPLLKLHGRTRWIESRGALFFNWTCAGFTVRFRGSFLRGTFLALADRLPFPPDAPEDLPVIAATGADGETLAVRRLLKDGENSIELFSGEAGEHTVRVVKLSENMRGKAALLALETDGEILPCPPEGKKISIEFIGDSITCGYGNEAPGRDSPFDTREENGWISFGAVCGRALDAEYSMISVSGIAACAAKYPMFPGKNMEDIYEYTDFYIDERFGEAPEKWSFTDRPDWVVINLGTNDSARVWAAQDLARADEEAAWFVERYETFLRRVRTLRPAAQIICTLGPLDYFLYDGIEKAVNRLRTDRSQGTAVWDGRIHAFKLRGVNLMTEGYGAVSHPSAKTHNRMGLELAERIRAFTRETTK